MFEYSFSHFMSAHDEDYFKALNEIKNGKKESHWMWFIFPQIKELCHSEISKYYSLRSLREAREYMKNELLCRHMNEICSALLKLETNDAGEIFGFPDDMKLRSSMTLFGRANPENPIFKQVLDKFFEGKEDDLTLFCVNDELDKPLDPTEKETKENQREGIKRLVWLINGMYYQPSNGEG